MLTNLLYGALGALAILSLRLLVRPARRLGSWTRRLYRRTIGMEHFEAMVIEEMRTYRRDVDFYTRNLPSRLQLSTLDQDVQGTATQLQRHLEAVSAERTRTNRLRREVEELGMLLHAYTETLGPIWNTAQGHRMPMRLLSTGHLQNIVDGGFGDYDARTFANRELARRAIDTAWRERQANGEAAPTLADYSRGRVTNDQRAMPPQIVLSPATLERVRQVLPLWAQNVITDLRTRRVSSISKANRDRLEVLPVWAQDLIAQLLQGVKL